MIEASVIAVGLLAYALGRFHEKLRRNRDLEEWVSEG